MPVKMTKQEARKIAIVVGNLSTEVGGVGTEIDRHSWSERTVTRREMVELIAAQAVRARRRDKYEEGRKKERVE